MKRIRALCDHWLRFVGIEKRVDDHDRADGGRDE
jgi:hypothetical protein